MKLLKISLFVLSVLLIVVPLADASSYLREPRAYSNPNYMGYNNSGMDQCNYELKSSRWGSITPGYCKKMAQVHGLAEEEVGYGVGYRSYYSRTIQIDDPAQAPRYYASPYVIIIK